MSDKFCRISTRRLIVSFFVLLIVLVAQEYALGPSRGDDSGAVITSQARTPSATPASSTSMKARSTTSQESLTPAVTGEDDEETDIVEEQRVTLESNTLNVPAALSASTGNPVVAENQKPGTLDWQLRRPGFRVANDIDHQVKGYASATSVNKGQSLTLRVSVRPVQTYTIDIYRMGWYQGKGGRLMRHVGPLNGIDQTACPVDLDTGLIECDWSPSYTFTVPTTWVSGVYVAMLTNSQKYQNYIIFVVRDDARKADLLFQQTVTTYQAYNRYPNDGRTGKSLYPNRSYGPLTKLGVVRSVKVSFDRPYEDSGTFLFWTYEYRFIRWMERSGYNVSYSTNIDTHASGNRLLNYKGFLSVGHDEYWSKEMYDAAEKARDSGVSLGFFGANSVYWQVRLEASSTSTLRWTPLTAPPQLSCGATRR